VRYGRKAQAQAVTSQCGFLSANDPRLHSGLGAALKASVEIHWPAGTFETFADLPADQLITIREGQGIVKGRSFR
jgi:enediyne biosynthesis protein E4